MKRQPSYGIARWILLNFACVLLAVFVIVDSAYEWKHDRQADAVTVMAIWLGPLVFATIVCVLCTRLVIRWRRRDKLEALSLAEKKCNFCGGDAVSTGFYASGPIYWCYDCDLELAHIIAGMAAAERPDLMKPGQTNEGSVFLALGSDPAFRPCYEKISQRAVEILKEKRRHGGDWQ